MKNFRLTCVTIFAGLLSIGSTASATTIFGAVNIEITPKNYYAIQIAEVIAIQQGSGIDVALASNGATATAADQIGPDSGPSFAIDGVYPSAYPSIYHSGSSGAAARLDITLANPTDLSSLTIWGRADCCQDRDIYKVSITDATSQVLYSGVLNVFRNYSVGGVASDFATVNFSSPAPEVGAWALMVFGFGCVGASLRLKRRQPSGATSA